MIELIYIPISTKLNRLESVIEHQERLSIRDEETSVACADLDRLLCDGYQVITQSHLQTLQGDDLLLVLHKRLQPYTDDQIEAIFAQAESGAAFYESWRASILQGVAAP